MIYRPDFDEECYRCGATPTVVVEGHMVPDTQLCGCCFWKSKKMVDPDLWNEQEEDEDGQ